MEHASVTRAAAPTWDGRFPRNEIISLLDVSRTFNLAESTSRDLTMGEVMDLVGVNDVRALTLGYGSSAGLEALRRAIAEDSGVPPGHVMTTTGTALGLFLLAFELCRAGDEVVLCTPCFPPTRDTLAACGAIVVEVALAFDAGYRLDLSRMERALTAKTRLVSLASPQNPSGVGMTRAELGALLDLMAQRAPQARLFVDETYREAAYGEAEVVPSLAGIDPRVIVGASVSKAFGAPGLRTGWLITSDDALRERLVVAKMNLVISGSTLDEALSAGILSQKARVLGPRRVALGQALDELAAWHAGEAHRLDWVRPDAGALCCFRLSAAAFDDAAVARFWDTLPTLDLQLAPGTWFGESERVFRLGFGYLPPERLTRGLAAVSAALDASANGVT